MNLIALINHEIFIFQVLSTEIYPKYRHPLHIKKTSIKGYFECWIEVNLNQAIWIMLTVIILRVESNAFQT